MHAAQRRSDGMPQTSVISKILSYCSQQHICHWVVGVIGAVLDQQVGTVHA